MDKQPQTKQWLNEIISGNRIPFAYVVDGEFLGECALVLQNDDPDYTIKGKRAYLSRLIVKKKQRNNGIANILVDYVMCEAKARGFSEVTVGVDKDNDLALHIYQTKGFNDVLFDGEDEYGPFVKLLKKL